jgi:hypothetical protein
LDFGQAVMTDLQPHLGNIVEVFGIHTGLLKGPPLGLDGAEVLFGPMFALSLP